MHGTPVGLYRRGKGKIGWEDRLDRKMLEWLLGITSCLLCVHVCECALVYGSSNGANFKIVQGLPIWFNFPLPALPGDGRSV